MLYFLSYFPVFPTPPSGFRSASSHRRRPRGASCCSKHVQGHDAVQLGRTGNVTPVEIQLSRRIQLLEIIWYGKMPNLWLWCFFPLFSILWSMNLLNSGCCFKLSIFGFKSFSHKLFKPVSDLCCSADICWLFELFKMFMLSPRLNGWPTLLTIVPTHKPTPPIVVFQRSAASKRQQFMSAASLNKAYVKAGMWLCRPRSSIPKQTWSDRNIVPF